METVQELEARRNAILEEMGSIRFLGLLDPLLRPSREDQYAKAREDQIQRRSGMA